MVPTVSRYSKFQSSPVPEDGCNSAVCRQHRQALGFNPHPSRRTGATRSSNGVCCQAHWFQSSPVPEDGCNSLSSRGSAAISCSFNPHPSRRTGATGAQMSTSPRLLCFNPHPSRRTGATVHRPVHEHTGIRVSILTRPGGRVQRSSISRRNAPATEFQSSPVPEDGCNGRRRKLCNGRILVSILTRPGGRVQPGGSPNGHGEFGRFNPHPSRRTGATILRC